MRPSLLPIALLFLAQCLRGQSGPMFQKGQFQLRIAFSLLPVSRSDARVDFGYVDGRPGASYPIDSIAAGYDLERRYFGHAFTLGLAYFVTERFRTGISLKPHLNAFLPNKAKNGKVYGIQFDLELDYVHPVSDQLSASFGTSASRILGGFGISSGGPRNKDYLLVNGNALYDDDIGFHIIDNSWAFGPRLGLHYRASNSVSLFADGGFQMAFGRKGRMNFAGLLEDGTVKWNGKAFGDPDVDFRIDGQRIGQDDIDRLPYRFSGWFLNLGTAIQLND